MWISALVLGLGLAAMPAAFVHQRAMICPAPREPAFASGPPSSFREIELRTSDGLRLQGLYRPARRGLPTSVFFHGNGHSLKGALAATGALGDAGYGLLVPEYRGYAGNPGSRPRPASIAAAMRRWTGSPVRRSRSAAPS
ncbi:MAG: alpha/beta hydrolase [Alphaproteobacteria bacterium]|nr:alpha/beta hydrolase [Alphaproteobacteria bacterium]